MKVKHSARGSYSRALRLGTTVPAVALVALGLAACSNGEEASSVAGTTPPVWIGSADPHAGEEGSHGHGSEGNSTEELSADIKDVTGASLGTATFTKIDSGKAVQVEIEARGLTPGFHGLHIHSVGKCEANSVAPAGGAPGAFLSAGGHFHIEGKAGHHAGDLTSLQVREDGTGLLVTTTDEVTFDSLLAGAGTALIVHSGGDNFGNIPTRYTLPDGAPVPDEITLSTGDGGSRVGCGVIAKHN
ncbi:MAG: superoxide dismutase[Cu-Zn] [Mycobacteriaceae bacterium]